MVRQGRLVGIVDDTQNIGGYDVSLELNSMFGLYGKGMLPLNENVTVYGLLGLTWAEGTASSGGYSFSSDDTDLSFGVGFDFEVAKKIHIELEYMKYLSKSDFDLAGASLGLAMHC